MIDSWEDTIAAWGLAQAGRWDEAAEHVGHSPELAALIAFRSKKPIESSDPVIAGWQAYYCAEYRTGLQSFLDYLERSDGANWKTAWAELGITKIATDCGRWRSALEWCAKAWNSAAASEHVDLLAEISGARGELLLRAGLAGDAAAAFSEDYALLGASSTFRGRVRCYQAHSWSRLGSHGADAALLAYRLAIHSPGESDTAAYATAGLALLGARLKSPSIIKEASSRELLGITKYWRMVAAARLCSEETDRKAMLLEAADALPPYYYAERWWFAGWTEALGLKLLDPPDLSVALNVPIPPSVVTPWTGVECPVPTHAIPDAPWWQSENLPTTAEAWWLLRDAFMP